MARPLLVDIRFPFCAYPCDCCGCGAIRGRDSALIHSYAEALRREIASNEGEFSDCRLHALRFSGGMASMLAGNDFNHILQSLSRVFELPPKLPVTMPASFGDISTGTLVYHRRYGIYRYDFACFALDKQDNVRFKERYPRENMPLYHTMLRSYEEKNMGMILIYGLEGMRPLSFRRSILCLTDGPSVHAILKPCRGPGAQGQGEMEEQLREGRSLLLEKGFAEYLPGCFALPGFEDPFRKARAEGMEILGFGLGAESRFEGMRTATTGDLPLYLAHSHSFAAITASLSPLGEEG